MLAGLYHLLCSGYQVNEDKDYMKVYEVLENLNNYAKKIQTIDCLQYMRLFKGTIWSARRKIKFR
jgi:hypothetical protein